MGRGQVVRQRVLVPRSQVRILAPQPSTSPRDRHLTRSRGHGRWARHAHALGGAEAPAPDPRPAHGRLGARDGAAARAGSARRDRLAREPRRSSPDVAVAVQERPLGTGDAVRSARDAVGDGAEPSARPLGRHAAADDRAARAARSRRTGASDAAATVPQLRAGRRPRVRPDRPRRATATVEAIVEAVDATPGAARAAASATPRSTSSAPTCSGPRSNGSSPHNAQGELYLTDAVRDLVGRGERVVAHVAADPAETEGVNTRAELAAAAAALRDRINHAHMLAGVTILDPATTWIEPDGRARGRTPSSIRSPSLRGLDAGRRGSRDRPARGRDRRRDRPRSGGRALLLPSPRNGARAARRRQARSWRSRRRGSARGRRCRISPTSATQRSGRGRTSAQGTITANFPHRAGRPKGEDDDRRQRPRRRGHYVRCSGHCWRRCVDGGRSRRHRRRPGQRARGLPTAAGQQGGARWKAGRLSRRCPVSRAGVPRRRRSSQSAARQSLTPQKRLAVVAGSSHPELAPKIAGHLGVELTSVDRTVVRRRLALLAASRTRSAAPTCSSSRPRRRRSART